MGLLLLLAAVICCVVVAGLAIAIGATIGAVLGEVAIFGLLVWGVVKVTLAIRGKTSGHEVPRVKGRHARRTTVFEPQRPPVPVDVEDVEDVQVDADVTERQERQERRKRTSYPKTYEYLDVDGTTKATDIERVMRGYRDVHVVGAYATYVIDTLDALEFRRRSLLPEIDAKFSEGSISWERFHVTAVSALDAVLRNCALLGNRIQTFDVTEYGRYEQFMEDGAFSTNPNPGQATLERWKLVCDTLGEMDEIKVATDGLMVELGKLSAEISALDRSKNQEHTKDIADEVSRLVDETRYYR